MQETKEGWRWKEKVGAGLAATIVMAGVLAPPAVQSFQFPPLARSNGTAATLEMKVLSSSIPTVAPKTTHSRKLVRVAKSSADKLLHRNSAANT